MIPPAKRVRQLPRYVFDELFSMRADAVSKGMRVYDLGVGNPDGRPSPAIRQALVEAMETPDPNYHRYSTFNCLPDLRGAVAQWYGQRFDVSLDPDTEVQPLVGSKEGLYHLMQAYLEVGDGILIPTPCYPAYLGAARLAEAAIWELPLVEENDFLIRFEDVPTDVARSAKMLLMNYPNNPTGAICEKDHYREALAFCHDHDILLVSDIAYSELSLTDGHVPSSVLELPGAREQCVEFQSLSKSHSMAGWRVGFCVGNSEVVATLLKLKSNVDFGIWMAVQRAATLALSDAESVEANRRLYRQRRDRVCQGLGRLGWNVSVPPATMYIWTRIPAAYGDDDWGFVRTLLERSGVLLSPGSAFGKTGRGFVRLSLIAENQQLDEVLSAIEKSGVLAS